MSLDGLLSRRWWVGLCLGRLVVPLVACFDSLALFSLECVLRRVCLSGSPQHRSSL